MRFWTCVTQATLQCPGLVVPSLPADLAGTGSRVHVLQIMGIPPTVATLLVDCSCPKLPKASRLELSTQELQAREVYVPGPRPEAQAGKSLP